MLVPIVDKDLEVVFGVLEGLNYSFFFSFYFFYFFLFFFIFTHSSVQCSVQLWTTFVVNLCFKMSEGGAKGIPRIL